MSNIEAMDCDIFSVEEMQSLLDLDLKSLIKEKAKRLVELRNLEINMLIIEQDVLWNKTNLLLQTNFKSLGLMDNEIMKAYVAKKVYDDECQAELDKVTIENKKDIIGIIDLIIQLRFKGE